MASLLIAAIPANASGAKSTFPGLGGADKSSSFSDYLERKMVTEPDERKSLFGVGQNGAANTAASGTDNAAQSQPAPKEKDDGTAQSASVSALLGQFMAEIRSQTKQNDTGPGNWTVTLPDSSLLVKLAADAGMSEAETAALMQQFQEQKGTMDLGSLLTALVNHFQVAQNQQPVTVAETDLPFLGAILERMGVSAEKIQEISGKAVTGDNQLDLGKFLSALDSVQADQPTTLSDWEGEQLQNLLDEAGVSKSMQRGLLPERSTPWETPNQPLKPVTLTMDRLQNLLIQGLQNVADNAPKADVPQLFTDLKAIFAQAGFSEKGVGWTPAVQKAMTDVYQNLLNNVDLASAQLRKMEVASSQVKQDLLASAAAAKEQASGGATAASGAAVQPVAQTAAAAQIKDENTADLLAEKQSESLLAAGGKTAPGSGVEHSQRAIVIPVNTQTQAVQPQPQIAPQAAAPQAPSLPPALEQQTMARISEGVLNGLRTDEHHLVLRLYPKELGEVKVEMMVRDDHVAVAFSMENSRVKEVLEKHMNMFQQNLERQGFTLEGCMVSVNQQNDGNTEAWRQFVQDWQGRYGDGQKTALAEGANDIPYLRPTAGDTGASGINLFA